MKSPVKLNRLLLIAVLLSQIDILDSSCKENTKFNFLEIILESKMSWRLHFWAFKELKLQNYDNYTATIGIDWVYYKPPIFSYSEVATHDIDLMIGANGTRFFPSF